MSSEGTAENRDDVLQMSAVPAGLYPALTKPGVETPGYFRLFLWNNFITPSGLESLWNRRAEILSSPVTSKIYTRLLVFLLATSRRIQFPAARTPRRSAWLTHICIRFHFDDVSPKIVRRVSCFSHSSKIEKDQDAPGLITCSFANFQILLSRTNLKIHDQPK